MSGAAGTSDVLARVVEVARAVPGTVAVALVGSWARGAARAGSDVDLVVLTERPERWLDSSDWLADVAPEAVLTSRREFGALQERRVRLPGGLEVELGIGRPSWAAVGRLDDGTRRVAVDGLVPLWDPNGLLEALLTAVR